ncbi:MAG TPA: hypothetical protein VFH88_11730, partial [Candidatus Krumholzibacteria bacterium]|nr:hypothetical protein [Candidatus Krumholzibacteria bacterium]
MQMSRRVVIFLLCALWIAAVAARVSTTSPRDTPYYDGASAMAYRHAMEVAEGHSLSAHDVKAGSPSGYVPDRYRAAGAEVITGLAYRAVHLVSEIDGRPFTRRFIVILAALCVFTAYGVASRLWGSRGAGLLAAFLVAFMPPLVKTTNGREFTHVIFAAFFVSLHAALALRALFPHRDDPGGRMTVPVRMLGAALAAFVLLWVWEPAPYLIAAWVVPVALMGRFDVRLRRWFVVSQALTMLAATCVLPHLLATHAFGSWMVAAAVSAAVAALLPGRARAQWRAPAVFVAGTLLLTVVATPL